MNELNNEFSFVRKTDNVQSEIVTELYPTNLQKVLSLSAESNIQSTEVNTGRLNFSGEICFNMVYLDADNQIQSTKKIAEFEGKFEDDAINTFSHSLINSNILEDKIISYTQSEVKVSAIVETSAEIVITQSYEVFDNEEIITQKEILKLCRATSSGQTRITLTENFNLKEKPSDILEVNANLVSRKITSGTEYFTLEGELIVSFVYKIDRDDKQEIRTEILKREIKEEIEAKDIAKENTIELVTDIKNCSITTMIEGNAINLEIPLNIIYIAFADYETEVISDCYSTEKEVQITYDTITRFCKSVTTYCQEKIDTMTEISENDTRIARIISADGERVFITNTIPQNDTITVEGIGYVNLIYQSDDDAGSILSMEIEIPFSDTFDLKSACEDDIVSVNAFVCDVSSKLKRGREISTDMEIGILITLYNNSSDVIIKDVKLLDEFSGNDINLQIYYGKKGETLWDIAKKLHTRPEIIENQNKGVIFPLEKDQTIVYYKQLKR